MPPRRLQADSGLKPKPLQPAASPIDTYVRPAQDTPLSQLATGLATLSPALARFGDAFMDDRNDREKQKGEQAARDAVEQAQRDGKLYKDAIKSGVIKPHQSPFFRTGAMEQFGRLAADRFNADLQVALAQSPVAQSVKPEDFDKFVSDFRQQWQEKNVGESNDRAFDVTFGRQADHYVSAQRNQFANEAGDRLVKYSLEAVHQEAFTVAMQGLDAGASTKTLVDALDQVAKRAIAQGHNGKLVNEQLGEAIVRVAKKRNDADVLKLADEIKAGSGPLGSISSIADKIEQAENEISAGNQNQLNTDYVREQREKAQRADAIQTDAVRLLEQNPDADLSDLRAIMSYVDPDGVPKLHDMQQAYRNRTYSEDPDVRAGAYRDYAEGRLTLRSLGTLLGKKQIRPETYLQLADAMKQDERYATGQAQQEGRFHKDPMFEEGQQKLRGLFYSFLQVDNQEFRWRFDAAEGELSELYFKKYPPGTKASEPEVRQWLQETAPKLFLKHVDKSTQDAYRQAFPQTGETKPAPKAPPATQAAPKVPPLKPTEVSAVQNELNERILGRRSQFSDSVGTLLYTYRSLGVNPSDLSSVQKFLNDMQSGRKP